ncbi:MAG: ATP-dependent helicase [Lachnospiraceae bacterium]|nr:ATP-dependent helicase [Lachnospiraceae bacterium]
MSKEQRRAVTHGEGPVLISAGPGSGKTFTITHRILYLIFEMGVSPQDIYVITFTKDAALSMNKRYQEILQDMKDTAGELSAVHFGTFHSFFYQIIRSHPKYKSYSLLNASAKNGILFRVLEKLGKEMLHGKELQEFFSNVSFYKNTGSVPKGQDEEFMMLSKAYDEEKDSLHLLDFDDMLTLCYKLLSEDEKLRKEWQNRIGYLLVDEFQDTNSVQYEVMKLLVKAPYNVCVVGDDDQAIYGFRGSRPGIMKQFLEDYSSSISITLGQNYRCGRAIVEASAKLIAKNKDRLGKILFAASGHGEATVNIREFESHHHMTEQCISELTQCTKEELGERAVLFRTNLRMNLFLAELIKRRVPFCTKEKVVSVYEHFVVKDIMDYLKAGGGCRERSLFLRILNRPRTHIGREALLSEQVDFDKMLRFYGKEGIGNYAAMQDVSRLQKGLDNLNRLKLSLGIEFILYYFGYDTYLRSKAAGDMELYEQWMELVQWLKEDSRSFKDVAQWEHFQQEYIAKARAPEKESETGGVHVMTLHGCKGLEFSQVYIMHVNEGNIPAIKKGEKETDEAIEEERRLFYVGMTRAKEALNILCVKGAQERTRPPSRFIKELRD